MESKGLQIASDLDTEQEEVEIIGIHTLCRLCASQNERLIGIFSEEGISNDLSNKINLYLPVKVAATDDLPLQCCWNCASTLLAWHELVITSVEVDKKFRNSQFITEKPVVEDGGFNNPVSPLSDENDACDNEGIKEVKFDLSDDDNVKQSLESPKQTSEGHCDICGKTVSRARDLKRHKSSCHPDSFNKKKFDEVANLITKTCTECDVMFENRTKLKKHVEEVHQLKQKRHRRRKNEILPQFYCDVCEKGFTRKHDMQKHKSQVHSLYIQKHEKKRNLEVLLKCKNRDSEGKVFYKCDICQRSFAQSYNLMRHRTIHTGIREFFCHICGMGFRMSNSLSRHIEASHNQVRNFSCDVCKKSFSARASRDEHMNIHTNNRPFVCDTCGKSFKQRASLHVHKLFHSDTYRFECNYCGKKFRRNQDLKVHRWMHTGHRPHACHKCKAAFRLKNDLNRHLRIHEKLIECVCNVCGSVFSQERYLKVHRKIHDKKQIVVKTEEGVQLNCS